MGGVISETVKTITFTVPYGTSLTGLTPAITIDGESVSPASGAAQDFTDGVPVNYTVLAWDTSTQVYAVTVNVIPPSTNTSMTSQVYTISTNGTARETITNVPFGTSSATLLAALSMGEDTQTWDTSTFTDPVISRQTIVVTAQDGATQVTYVVYVNLIPGDVDHDGAVT